MKNNKNFFDNFYLLDNVTLYRYAIIYVVIIFSIVILLQVGFIFIEKKIINQMIVSNEKRATINSLIVKKNESTELKKITDELISKDNSFRIKDYVTSILQKNGYSKKIVNGGDSIIEQPSKAGYIELSTGFELSTLGLEDVINILRACENDTRVYFKEIEIKNNSESKTLTLAFVIATTQILN